jgi:menaquinone-dependent protoporphyrinogen IX oxidase
MRLPTRTSDINALVGYSAVAVGGALYFFRLHKNARRFLSRHRKAMVQVIGVTSLFLLFSPPQWCGSG